MNIFNLSFGKDSMATLILAAKQGIPIDRVMYVEVKFNNEISGEHPIMAEWIPFAEKRLKELFGITVEHTSKGTYLEHFFHKKIKGKFEGYNNGFPFVIHAWCNSLKRDAIRVYMQQFKGQTITQFIGMAYDELPRWNRMLAKETKTMKYRSLLVEQKLTEQDAMGICRRYDLLSPMYDFDGIFRGGCWFCPKQCLADLYSLWKNYPDLYQKLIDLEPYSLLNKFKPNGVTLESLAERFAEGYIPKRKKKAREFVQIDMFEKIDGGDEQTWKD